MISTIEMNEREELLRLAQKNRILRIDSGSDGMTIRGAIDAINKYSSIIEDAAFPKEYYHLLR